MNNAPRYRRRDKHPVNAGLIFYQYKNGKEYWVTPERFETNDIVRKKRSAEWQKKNAKRRNQQYLKWLNKPGNLAVKKRAYRNWVNRPSGRLVRRKITQRYLKTTDGRLINCVRSRIAVALKRGYTKSASMLELIGCSIQEFKLHLESQFQLGMSWKNMGKWEIDHRVPLSSFNLADPEQQKLAFNFHNCRPLWKQANRQKSDKMEDGVRGRDIRKIIPFKAA